MCSTAKDVFMGFTQERFPAGTHMCLIYSDEDERRKIISKFLKGGLINSEKVSYFADEMSQEEVKDWLAEMDVDIIENGSSNQLDILAAEEVYCPDGEFIPEIMLENLRVFYSQAKDDGYPGVRVSGEMSWALKNIPGADRLMEYEALVNNVLITHPVTAICQYDARRFSGENILDVLKVHPMMIVHGQVVRNPYFIKPEVFLESHNINNHNK